MKKIIIIVFILFLLLIYLLLSTKEENKRIINPDNGNYDMVCSYVDSYKFEDEDIESITYAYLNIDGDIVNSLLMETKVEKNTYSYDPDLADEYTELFNNISGIDYVTLSDENYYIERVIYNFNEIDVENVQSVFGDMLEKDSFFTKEKFSNKLTDIKESFIPEFECK